MAGLRPRTVRTYALGAPAAVQVAVLHPGQSSCEGPVTSAEAVTGVELFGAGSTGQSTASVHVVRASDHQALASGELHPGPGNAEIIVPLDRAAPASTPLRICVEDTSGDFALWGSGPVDPNVTLTGPGRGLQFALNLVNDRHSLLASLGLAFDRASLWRGSWIGNWLFWVLAAALAASFGLGVVAVIRAAGEDEDITQSERRLPADVSDEREDQRSQAGQDRPEPVR